MTDGSFTYTPNKSFIGTDTATYTVSNGFVTAGGTVTIDVFNYAPVAVADAYGPDIVWP